MNGRSDHGDDARKDEPPPDGLIERAQQYLINRRATEENKGDPEDDAAGARHRTATKKDMPGCPPFMLLEPRVPEDM